jgi:hypothetical protein
VSYVKESLKLGQILHEYDCTIIPINPKTKYLLPFDNELIINNKISLIIETQGLQHYIVNSWYKTLSNKHKTTPEYELHKRQLYDRYKRIYAKSKGYYYLEIPYWTDNKQNEWKSLIDNKINEILNK